MPPLQPLLERLKATRPYRAWTRYGESNGDLLAAGVGYFAFFSIFPALALAFAIFGFVLQGRPDLVTAIADYLNTTLPGMVKTPDHPEGIISVQAPTSLTLTLTGIISFVTLLLAGLGWVGALRTGIRGIFGLEASIGSAVRTKARDLFVLVTMGLAIAVSAILTSVIGGLAQRVAGWIGLAGNGPLVGLVGLVVGVVFDTLILVVLLRMLSGAPLPMRDVRQGAVVGATVLTVLKLFGGFLIGHATGNPLLGAVAVSVGLLFWLNLMSKVILLSAAWVVGDVDLSRLGDDTGRSAISQALRPAFVAPLPPDADTSLVPYAAAPVATPRAVPAPAVTRRVDRVSVAAGVLVGAAAASVLEGVRRLRRR
ncbi:YihY/virulence factor BrkB family protein [Terrabacter sp. NPDC080008]|uniref:YihY/virulence factor BrkB family protein n=1 Tax=Terrabacter sp. NPDC080008 TaxID=3155176 RepID=UPI00344BFB30